MNDNTSNQQNSIEIQLSKYLFFDLETCRNKEHFSELSEREQHNFLVKNRSKISNVLSKLSVDERYAVELYSEMNDEVSLKQKQELYAANGSFFAEFASLVCCGLGAYTSKGEERTNVISLSNSDNNEKNMLKKISEIFSKAEGNAKILAGWNIKNFDIPFLVKRMMINKVKVPNILKFYDKKPWDIKLLELSEVWASGKYGDISTLDSVSSALNLNNPKGGVVNGMNVSDTIFSHGNIELIDEYCLLDVKVTMDIAKEITPYILF
jgi:predicted PolB exonuclease-like 3'-5' exonuclease